MAQSNLPPRQAVTFDALYGGGGGGAGCEADDVTLVTIVAGAIDERG